MARNVDLVRKVKLKPRKCHKTQYSNIHSRIVARNSADRASLETGIHGMERSSIYYCNPMRSGQKGGVEHAHTLLRRVLPKGTSFEFLTQWDENLIVNHINSLPRESLCGKSTL